MINGLFEELSEEEMLSVNGACAGGANPYAAMQPCQECNSKYYYRRCNGWRWRCYRSFCNFGNYRSSWTT